MPSIIHLLLAATMAGASASAAAQLAEPISSSLFLSATAIAIPPGGAQSFDSDAASQGSTLNPLSASVSAQDMAVDPDFGAVSVAAFGSARAAWAHAASGNVQFEQVGWTVSNGVKASLQPGEVWEYSFMLNDAANFNLGVAIDLSGSNTRGIGSYQFFIADVTGGGFVHSDNFGSNRGTTPIVRETARYALEPGAYLARIRGVSGIAGVVLDRTAYKDATFAFDIVPIAVIPELATWRMFGLGALIILAMTQRTKRSIGGLCALLVCK